MRRLIALPTDKIAKMGLLICLGMILSYVETLVVLVPGVPGIKIGLSNALVILLLYTYGMGYCILYQLCRIVLTSLLFGNVFGCLFSLAGAGCSLLIMYICKKIRFIDVSANSMIGGIAHNMAQLAVAAVLIHHASVWYYFPVLLLAGALSGYAVGMIGTIILRRRLL